MCHCHCRNFFFFFFCLFRLHSFAAFHFKYQTICVCAWSNIINCISMSLCFHSHSNLYLMFRINFVLWLMFRVFSVVIVVISVVCCFYCNFSHLFCGALVRTTFTSIDTCPCRLLSFFSISFRLPTR